MTKLNADNAATVSTEQGAKVRNRKPRAPKAGRQFPVVLKDILRDIAVDQPKTTLTTKAMRVKLRAKMNATHEHNAGWEARTQVQYDAIRSLFDAPYAAKVAKPARVRKAKVTTQEVPA